MFSPRVSHSSITPHAVVLMLRAYAFTGRRRPVLILLCAALAAMVGIQLWVFTDTLACEPPPAPPRPSPD